LLFTVYVGSSAKSIQIRQDLEVTIVAEGKLPHFVLTQSIMFEKPNNAQCN